MFVTDALHSGVDKILFRSNDDHSTEMDRRNLVQFRRQSLSDPTGKVGDGEPQSFLESAALAGYAAFSDRCHDGDLGYAADCLGITQLSRLLRGMLSQPWLPMAQKMRNAAKRSIAVP